MAHDLSAHPLSVHTDDRPADDYAGFWAEANRQADALGLFRFEDDDGASIREMAEHQAAEDERRGVTDIYSWDQVWDG